MDDDIRFRIVKIDHRNKAIHGFFTTKYDKNVIKSDDVIMRGDEVYRLRDGLPPGSRGITWWHGEFHGQPIMGSTWLFTKSDWEIAKHGEEGQLVGSSKLFKKDKIIKSDYMSATRDAIEKARKIIQKSGDLTPEKALASAFDDHKLYRDYRIEKELNVAKKHEAAKQEELSAVDEFAELVKSYIRKSDGTESLEQIEANVWKDHPGLYEKYRSGSRGRYV